MWYARRSVPLAFVVWRKIFFAACQGFGWIGILLQLLKLGSETNRPLNVSLYGGIVQLVWLLSRVYPPLGTALSKLKVLHRNALSRRRKRMAVFIFVRSTI